MNPGINLFAGFSATSASQDKSLYYSPDSPYSESEYCELKNLIEKCAKKSQNTKLKSMSRITSLCEEATDHTLFIDLLPNWIFLFTRMVKYDQEKSVRESAFRLQALFFAKFKTKFLNFVEEIFTPLWLGRNDPCKEVAESAKRAFLTAFPENRHKAVLEKCIERYIREILPILNKELQETEEIMERLMSSALLGIKDALLVTDTIKTQCSIFLEEPKLWGFIELSHKPMVRCAALHCFDTFLTLNLLNESHLAICCPIIFGLISDKNRLVHQILWGQVLQNLMEKFSGFASFINSTKILNELVVCTSRGASGAGPTFYLALVKILSLFDKEKLQEKKTIENLLMGILKGLNTDEGGFYGKYALNAYYEVLLYVYTKVIENNKFLDIFFVHPIGLYLGCNTQVNPNSYLTVIPELLGQSLGYLEAKAQLPDISKHLFQLISKTLSEKVEITVKFLQEFAKHLGSQGLQCKTLLQNLLYIIHSQLSQEIENKLIVKDFTEINLQLSLFRTFSEITMTYSSFEPKVYEWWVRGCTEGLPLEILASIANVIYIHPSYWKQAIDFSNLNLDQLNLLIPEKYEVQLVNTSKTLEFCEFLASLLNRLGKAENLSEIGKVSKCLKKLYHKDMVAHENLIELVNEITDKCINTITSRTSQREFSDQTEKEVTINFTIVLEIFSILQTKIYEKSAVLLSRFLLSQGWKAKTDELWENCKHLKPEILQLFVDTLQDLLIDSLSHTKDWRNLLLVSVKLLNTSPDKESLLSNLFTPSLFSDFYLNTNIWHLFSKLVIDSATDITPLLQRNIWMLSRLLGCNVVPCLSTSLLLHSSLQKYCSSTCIPLICSQIRSKSLPFTQSLLDSLLSLSKQYISYRVVLIQCLKLSLFSEDSVSQWSQSEILHLYTFCMSQLQEDSNYTLILCDIIYIFKSVLSESLYNETLEKWRSLAYAGEDQVHVRIYAACVPDTALDSLPQDIACLARIIDKGLRPTDLALVLSIVRRAGFQSVPDLEKIELLLISILLEGKDLHEVLPYVQRLLATPQYIFNKEQISELIINLPLHCLELSQPELLEISETFTRIYSIVDENIDEESCFQILAQDCQVGLAKSVYSLMEYAYSQCEIKRTRVQAIPEHAIRLINYVPNVKTEVMESKTLSYIFGWMLLIEKYRMDRFHREKNNEAISEFMVCFKDLLESTPELVTVFLTTLMGYLHDESSLDIAFNVAWIDILNEDSCAGLACLAMYKFLSTFPSLGRSWWLGTERFLSNSVQAVVKKRISSMILSQEIKNIENRQLEWKEKGLSIVCSRAARDITAVFSKSEFSVQVTLLVPTDYPLSSPDPTLTKKVKISEEKIRKWQLSIVQLLQQENSSILEVLMVWKEHVERELEGIEDCFICYYLVHPTDKSLPNLPCQVCNNKFHKLCIQKWFNSSHNATCPLCRNPFRS